MPDQRQIGIHKFDLNYSEGIDFHISLIILKRFRTSNPKNQRKPKYT